VAVGRRGAPVQIRSVRFFRGDREPHVSGRFKKRHRVRRAAGRLRPASGRPGEQRASAPADCAPRRETRSIRVEGVLPGATGGALVRTSGPRIDANATGGALVRTGGPRIDAGATGGALVRTGGPRVDAGATGGALVRTGGPRVDAGATGGALVRTSGPRVDAGATSRQQAATSGELGSNLGAEAGLIRSHAAGPAKP
jgi:hypothetical protein